MTFPTTVFASEAKQSALDRRCEGAQRPRPAPEAQRMGQSAVYWHGQRIKGGLPRPLIVSQKFQLFG